MALLVRASKIRCLIEGRGVRTEYSFSSHLERGGGTCCDRLQRPNPRTIQSPEGCARRWKAWAECYSQERPGCPESADCRGGRRVDYRVRQSNQPFSCAVGGALRRVCDSRFDRRKSVAD